METGLDVLSRAASFLERVKHERMEDGGTLVMSETSVNNPDIHDDHKLVSGKDLPTKSVKQLRTRARRDPTIGMKPGEKSTGGDRRSPKRRINGTGDHPPYRTIKKLLNISNRAESSQSNSLASLEELTPTETRAQELPLNLTTTTQSLSQYSSAGSTTTTLPTYTQLRPSVILRAAHSALGLDSSSAHSNPAYSSSPTTRSPSASPLSRRAVLTDGADPASIDEHFRRSLGKDYPCYVRSQSSPGASPRQTTITESDDDHDFVDGSVDDHFARSLGQSKWDEIKSRNNASVNNSDANSVDDHFAKALGEKWTLIKAQQSTSSPCQNDRQNGSSSVIASS